MRIAYISSTLIGVHDRLFLESLVAGGYDTHLVTFFPGSLPEAITRIQGLSITCLGQFPFGDLVRFAAVARAPALRSVLQRLQPDVVHSGYVWKDGFAAVATGWPRQLCMPWGSDVLVDPQRSAVCRAVTRFTLGRASAIVCDAEVVRRRIGQLVRGAENKTTVFPWGINLDRFNPVGPRIEQLPIGWSAADPILVYARGFLAQVYAPEDLITAFKQVLPHYPRARLVLLGDGLLEDGAHQLVKRLGLEASVHFAGRVTPDKMAAWLRTATIWVSVSLSDGTSVALLEAMACRLPVICSDLEATREWIRPGVNGLVVPPRDPHGVSMAILRMLNTPSERTRFADASLDIVRARADWRVNFKTLEHVYASIL